MRMLPFALVLLPLVVHASNVLACEDEDDEDGEDDEDRAHAGVDHEDDVPPPPEIFHSDRRIGVQPLDLTPELRVYFGAPDDAGVMIARVEKDSPAERAGLKVGDIIIRAGGEKIDESSALILAVSKTPPGLSINLEILRDREREEFDVHADHNRGKNRFIRFGARDDEPFVSFDREAMREELRVLRQHLDRLRERMDRSK